MATYTLKGINKTLLESAQSKAETEGDNLNAVIVAAISAYVTGHSPAAAFAARGGVARARALTFSERSTIARNAANARWGKPSARK